jgi:hypothetical protein
MQKMRHKPLDTAFSLDRINPIKALLYANRL